MEQTIGAGMLGVEAIPALLYTLMVIKVPNSPRWLVIQKKDYESALNVLKRIYTGEAAKNHLDEIIADANLPKISDKLFQKKI